MYSMAEMQSMATNVFSAYASVAASIMLFRSFATDLIPESVKEAILASLAHFFKHFLGRYFNPFSAKVTMVIDDLSGIAPNEMYEAAEIYLRTIDDPTADRFKLSKNPKQKNMTLSVDRDQLVVDFFKGVKLTWQFVLVESDKQRFYSPDKRFFELTFDKGRKDDIINEYLPSVLAKAKQIKENDKAVKLFTKDCDFDDDDEFGEKGRGDWGCVNLDHPATFDKLAMDPCLKRAVIEDLDRFVRRKNFYKRVGKAWKRGYLLYGPPGTGKSSLIAAMANYLKFDVYDLELTSVYSNLDLRRLLLSTTNRSILVIEDIDCSVQMNDRKGESENDTRSNKLTLSGVLNFIDGLWSTCGDERIIVFTTNHKEKLDPALLRPGRMDMHVHMGYCTPEGFDVLASNYLGVKDRSTARILEIKGLIEEVEVTPAEVAEHLMRSEDADAAIDGVLDLLKKKKKEEKSRVPEKVGDDKEIKIVETEIETPKKKKLGGFVRSLSRYRRRSRKN